MLDQVRQQHREQLRTSPDRLLKLRRKPGTPPYDALPVPSRTSSMLSSV